MAIADARPVPQKNVAFRVTFPILDADGDLVTGAAALDSEVSKDGGTFADATNEATEIATSSGVYFLDLTATEMNADTVAVIVKTTTTGAKTTVLVMYPEEAGDVRVNLTQWSGVAPNALTAGRVDAIVGAYASGQGPLQSTVAGRTLDVTTTGEAGIDWANIGAPTTAQTLSGTTIGTLTTNSDKTGYTLTTAGEDSIVNKVWDEPTADHTAAGSYGQAALPTRNGTAQGGAAGTITLDTGASAVDDFYNNQLIFLTAGTGSRQARIISDYVGSTKVATVQGNWITTPDSTSVFVIYPAAESAQAAPSLTSIVNGVWNEAMSGHTTSGSYGQRLRDIRTGTAQAGAAGTITLDSGANATDDFYKNTLIHITAGTGIHQSRMISAYTGSTKVATVNSNWITTPDSTSVFVIHPFGSIPGATAPSAAEVADAVWDEAVDGTNTARQYQRLAASALFGKLSGAATTTVTIRDVADTKARITATVDGDGNRSAVTLDSA